MAKKKKVAKKRVPGQTPSTPAKAKKKASTGAARKPQAPSKPRASNGSSLTDAAVKVLQGVKEPLGASAIYAKIKARGLWKTTAATPANTLHSALAGEIKRGTKGNGGKGARFTHTKGKGFTLRSAPKPKVAKPRTKASKKKVLKKKVAKAK